MFPNGWPGIALLLLRAITGILLIHDTVFALQNESLLAGIIFHLTGVAAGILILVGLWTPLAGILIVGVELGIAISTAGSLRDFVVLTSLGAALAMLGPGVLSIDSLLFGRKRIGFRDR